MTEARRFDPERMLDLAGGEPAFLRELAAVLRTSTARQLLGLRSALAAADRSDIARIAHQLKGGLGTFGDPRLNAQTAELEAHALTTSDAALTALFDTLEADIGWVGERLEAIAAQWSGEAPEPDSGVMIETHSGP